MKTPPWGKTVTTWPLTARRIALRRAIVTPDAM